MKLDFVRKEVKEYINSCVKPVYKTFDKAHSTSHFNFVTKNCVDYGKELIEKGVELNLEIAYVVGALHDIGISKGREGHAKSSGEIVRNDQKLKEFYFEDEIENLTSDSVVIIRAHGEPPETFEYLKNKGIDFRDCTCLNVSKIHELVKEYSEKGYAVIILGKHKKALHPEVFGTIGWAKTDVVLIESSEDVEKLKELKNDKFYLVCQTTFNMKKADELISEIQV